MFGNRESGQFLVIHLLHHHRKHLLFFNFSIPISISILIFQRCIIKFNFKSIFNCQIQFQIYFQFQIFKAASSNSISNLFSIPILQSCIFNFNFSKLHCQIQFHIYFQFQFCKAAFSISKLHHQIQFQIYFQFQIFKFTLSNSISNLFSISNFQSCIVKFNFKSIFNFNSAKLHFQF